MMQIIAVLNEPFFFERSHKSDRGRMCHGIVPFQINQLNPAVAFAVEVFQYLVLGYGAPVILEHSVGLLVKFQSRFFMRIAATSSFILPFVLS